MCINIRIRTIRNKYNKVYEIAGEYGITDAYYQMLEQSINRAPEFWLWSHNRWSRTRKEFNERFEVVDGKVKAKG